MTTGVGFAWSRAERLSRVSPRYPAYSYMHTVPYVRACQPPLQIGPDPQKPKRSFARSPPVKPTPTNTTIYGTHRLPLLLDVAV